MEQPLYIQNPLKPGLSLSIEILKLRSGSTSKLFCGIQLFRRWGVQPEPVVVRRQLLVQRGGYLGFWAWVLPYKNMIGSVLGLMLVEEWCAIAQTPYSTHAQTQASYE